MRSPAGTGKWAAVAFAVLALAGLVAPAGDVNAAATRASPVPPALVGCWRRNVTAADFRRAGTAGLPVGVFSMSIKAAGAVPVFTPGTTCGDDPDFTTRFAVAGVRVTIGTVLYCVSKGVYSWKVVGRSLTLRAVADATCPLRVGLFTGVWRKI